MNLFCQISWWFEFMNYLQVIPLSLAVILSCYITIPIWRKRDVAGAIPLLIMAIAIVIWSFFSIVHLCVNTIIAKQTMVAFEFIGAAAIPPAWLAFTLRISGYRGKFGVFPLVLAGLAGVAMVFLVSTNHLHELVWRDIEENGKIISKPWWVYWAFMTYVYTIGIAGFLIIGQKIIYSQGIFRQQFLFIVLALLIPFVVNFFEDMGYRLWPDTSATSGAIIVSVVLIWVGLLRFRILGVIPIAHGILMDRMQDGVLVTDSQGALIDINKSAIYLLHGDDHVASEALIAPIQSKWEEIINGYKNNKSDPYELELSRNGKPAVIEIRVNLLLDKNQEIQGALFLMRDITNRKQEEASRLERLKRKRASSKMFCCNWLRWNPSPWA